VLRAGRQCRDTAATVADWRGGQAIIAAGCQALSEVLLLGVEGKRVYPEGAFLQHQEEHMVQVVCATAVCNPVNDSLPWLQYLVSSDNPKGNLVQGCL
jgi:hypothetical protein